MENLMMPNHIGIILDGNRRWAKKHGLSPWEGHREGAKTFEKFINWCLELNIPQISAYVLSTENLNRPKREVNEILRLLKEYLDKLENEKKDIFDKYKVKIRFCGDFRRLPKSLVKIMNRIMRRTEKYDKKILNILIAYGGKYELTKAIKNIAEKILKSGRIRITKKDIEENLLISGDVDLVIRTGGNYRLSNFLLWQTAYAEIYVTKTLWPDFKKRNLIKAIEWFNNVKRNFGK
ncbi:MAG: di-trans,poly-cis-decaprenylcistransferase [Candidatus Aenigmarchaeota archaeon]|nr:di-trans,poly-cis-decaprenylcistransferase [Candidatus Aenigmarchaeota archaeon]